MRKLFKKILFLFFFFHLSQIAQALPLNQRWEIELQHPESGFTEELKKKLNQRHVVFIDGIMNEAAQLIGNYFYDNIAEIENLGIPFSHISPSSRRSIPENAETLTLEIQRIYSQVQVPLILVGHSKGAAEALYALLKYPELMTANQVDRAVLINSAIGGSPLTQDLVGGFFGNCLQIFLNSSIHSLSPAKAHENFKNIYESFHFKIQETAFQDISRRIFYIRSFYSPGESLSMGIQTVLFFFKQPLNHKNQHDGLLLVTDQMLNLSPPFGIDLGVLKSDHIELVVSGQFSRSNSEQRRAFTRAFLQQIYEETEIQPQ